MLMLVFSTMVHPFMKCFVPKCPYSSENAPGKLFFYVPKGDRRNDWLKAASYLKKVSPKSNLWCCEDHFNVEHDVENWIKYQIFKNINEKVRLILKPGVVPHKFQCQSSQPFSDLENHPPQVNIGASTSKTNASVMQEPSVGTLVENLSQPIPLLSDFDKRTTVQINVHATSPRMNENPKKGSVDSIKGNLSQQNPASLNPSGKCKCNCNCAACGKEAGESFRQIKAKPQLGISKIFTENYIPNLSSGKRKKKAEFQDYISFSQCSDLSTSSPLLAENQESPEQDYELQFDRLQSQIYNMKTMRRNPRRYLGLSNETMNLISSLKKFCNLEEIKIFIVLRKIRLNEPLDMLSDIFGMDRSVISETLKSSIPLIAAYLKRFIFWPEKEVILSNLPITFRAKYSKVQSIIDCFEIQIEKPSNPIHQALTWSQYKHCNTVKYLISCTPDGHINFVSQGFVGRTSDTKLFEHSGLLDLLKPGASVMADRGFKHVETSILQRDCHLEKPHSVDNSTCLTKQQVRESKEIASLRVHVERVIQRLRDYLFVAPHACFHHELMCQVDNVVTVVCALANLQYPLIK